MRKLKTRELGRKSKSEVLKSRRIPVIIVLDNVRSALNIGSVFRTADAFLIERIYLCGISATPPDTAIHKTALGATESVPWKYFKTTTDAVNELKAEHWKIFAVEQTKNAKDLHSFIPEAGEKAAFIFGHEINGVSQEVIDCCEGSIMIPQEGMKHSLNIAVSAGIVMWELFVKLRNKN